MVRDDEWKLIHYPKSHRDQLFHLPSDPFEMEDLAHRPQYAAKLEELRGHLHAWQRGVGDPELGR